MSLVSSAEISGSPLRSPRAAYYTRLETHQERKFERIRDIFNQALGDDFQGALLTTGSDARRESMSGSGMELILVLGSPAAISLEVERCQYSPSMSSPDSSSMIGRFPSVSDGDGSVSPVNMLLQPEENEIGDGACSCAGGSQGKKNNQTSLPDSASREGHSEISFTAQGTSLVAFSSPSPLLALVTAIQGITSKHPQHFDPKLQVYELGNGSPFQYWLSAERKTIPTRAVDACFITGDRRLYDAYRGLTCSHLMRMNSHDRKSFEKNFVVPAISELTACMSGEKTSPIHLQEGILFFDKDRTKSTKYPFLRPVQYHLMRILIYALHEGENKCDPVSNPSQKAILASQIPLRIEARIRWAHANGFLSISGEKMDRLCKAYYKSLLWYEASQKAFEENQATEIRVPREEILEVAETIHDFVSNCHPNPLSPKK